MQELLSVTLISVDNHMIQVSLRVNHLLIEPLLSVLVQVLGILLELLVELGLLAIYLLVIDSVVLSETLHAGA